MNIRLVRSEDIDIVSKIIVEGLDDRDSEIKEKVMEEIKLFNKVHFNYYYLAELENEVVGVLQVLDYEKIFHVSVLSILKTHQGKDIGSHLLKSILLNLKNIQLIQVYSNDAAKEFYLKQGFRYVESACLYEINTINIHLDQQNHDIEVTTKLMKWMLDLDKLTTGYSKRPLFELLIELGAKIITYGKSGYVLLYNNTIGPVLAKNFEIAINLIIKAIELGGKYITILEPQLSHYKNSTKITMRNLDIGHKMRFGDSLDKNLDLEFAIHSFGFS
ncbi:MAG: hypothetical protein HeimC2_12220 [Candidatus Heimdallarchaeota archaeon LC_2]|nr:MAG: hypothetical protein HeimC2_12220 [Candidatus Heimdallarchaeota archaeon LC_2]